jgi:endonuclease YncB( thermonuclease family)
VFGWRRKSDGVRWVQYVPTELRLRRQQRRERIEAAKIEVEGMARHAARRASAGAANGARAGAAAVSRGVAAGIAGLGNLVIGLAQSIAPILRWLAQAMASVGARLGQPQAMRLVGLVGVLALLGGLVRVFSSGADLESRLALAGGAVLVLGALAPTAWRALGPPLARIALDALKTQRPGLGVATRRHIGRTAPAALGILLLGGIAGGGYWALASLLAPSQPLSGRAVALSAETLKVGETEVRLAGIAAPLAEQRCGEGQRRWRCGEAAQRSLAALVRGRSLECTLSGSDEAGRPLARCRSGDKDIAAELVREGHVWADERDRGGYRKLEAVAKEAKLGVWRSPSVPPWEWRQQVWEEAARQAPDRCPVKAETSRGEKLYYLPWQASYERVRIAKASAKEKLRGLDKGGRWFCSEEEARREGYRLAGERG